MGVLEWSRFQRFNVRTNVMKEKIWEKEGPTISKHEHTELNTR